jgi:hypothetical protein
VIAASGFGAPAAGVVTNTVSDARRRREPADQACSREAASARPAPPLRAGGASTVILAAISAAVAPSRATSNRSLAPGGGARLADHDRDKSGAALLVAVAVTAFKPPGSSSWRAPPARRHGQHRRT